MGSAVSSKPFFAIGALAGVASSAVYTQRRPLIHFARHHWQRRNVRDLIQFRNGHFVGPVAVDGRHHVLVGRTFHTHVQISNPNDDDDNANDETTSIERVLEVTVLDDPVRLVLRDIRFVPYSSVHSNNPVPDLEANFPFVRYEWELHPDGTTRRFEENVAVVHAHFWSNWSRPFRGTTQVTQQCVKREFYEWPTGEKMTDMAMNVEETSFDQLRRRGVFFKNDGVLFVSCTADEIDGFPPQWACTQSETKAIEV